MKRRVVTLMTREGCHLCEEAKKALRRVRAEIDFSISEIDIDSDPKLSYEYGERVPVILVDGVEHGYWRVEEERLRAALVEPESAEKPGDT